MYYFFIFKYTENLNYCVIDCGTDRKQDLLFGVMVDLQVDKLHRAF